MKKVGVLFLLILIGSRLGFADHLNGGEMSYRCISNNSYEITLIIYRNCNSLNNNLDQVSNITLYDRNSNFPVTTFQIPLIGSERIPVPPATPCFTPPDVCVDKLTYRGRVNFVVPAAGSRLVYQRCCRNPAITNLVNAGNIGNTFELLIPPPSVAACNSSPVFRDPAPNFTCIGQESIFDFSATDADGDVLTYALCTPKQGASSADPLPTTPSLPPYPNVPYSGSFTFDKPLGTNASISIHPTTGQLSVTPGFVGLFVVGICVTESRGGVVLGQTMRDFQFNVTDCRIPQSNPSAVLDNNSVGKLNDSTYVFCSSTTVTFQNLTTGTVVNQSWDFGIPGRTDDTSNLRNPVFTYTDTGFYKVTLITNRGTECADTGRMYVRLNPRLTADFTFQNNVCGGTNVQFTDASSSELNDINQWRWRLGTDSVFIQNPSKVFGVPGTIPISLKVTTPRGCVATVTKNLIVAPGPIANFSLQQVCYGKRALFTNQSTITGGTISKYYWNLGNGTIDSVNTNTSATYPTDGNYNVQLIAVSQNGCRDTIVKSVNITDSLKPNFTFPASNCQQSSVQFTNTSTGNYTGYTWYFGDAANSTSTAVNPSFTYPTDGTFPVKLVVNHAICGRDSIQKNITIKQKPTVTLPQNIALCNGSVTTLSVPNTFDSLRWNTNQTSNTISVNGTPNPIRVDVYKNGCSNFATTTLQIKPKPTANFNLRQVCYGIRALYTNQSTISGGSITNYYWNFGNGLIDSVNANPATIYPSNSTYNVQLIAVSDNGCRDTINKSIAIIDSLKPNFTFPVSNCQQSPVQFSNTSTGNYTGFNWNFGVNSTSTSTATNPTFTYNVDGIFPVNLVVNHAICGKDSIQKTIVIKPKPAVSLAQNIPLCNGSTTILSVPNQYDSLRWNTNETSNSITVNGSINPLRIDVYKNGCTNFATTALQLKPKPVASFSTDKYCSNKPTSFLNTSTVASPDNIAQYNWTINNGAFTSQQAAPVFNLNQITNYNVQLIVTTNSGCKDTFTRVLALRDTFIPGITMPTSVCIKSPAQFQDNSKGDNISYNWQFGDGKSSTLQNPVNTYNSSGNFTIKLVIQNKNCGLDSTSGNVFVKPLPVINLSDSIIMCPGEQRTLVAGGDFDSVFWSNGAFVNPATIDGNQPVVSVLAFKDGCSNTDSIRIILNCDIYIPTAFSPNNDGYNDVFNLIPLNISSYNLKVYNRWGELVFETDDLSKSWDGTYKGVACPVDNYIYTATGIKKDNQSFSIKGTLTLLR